MSKLIAFGWYGGKFSHLDWLLPLLPETTHYCEPFGGSAAVLLNRKPSPVETYNDSPRSIFASPIPKSAPMMRTRAGITMKPGSGHLRRGIACPAIRQLRF